MDSPASVLCRHWPPRRWRVCHDGRTQSLLWWLSGRRAHSAWHLPVTDNKHTVNRATSSMPQRSLFEFMTFYSCRYINHSNFLYPLYRSMATEIHHTEQELLPICLFQRYDSFYNYKFPYISVQSFIGIAWNLSNYAIDSFNMRLLI